MIEIVLLGAPRGKERVKRAGAGTHSYTPERTVNYEGRMAAAASAAMGDKPPLTGPIELHVVMKFPVPESKPKKWKAAALRGEIWQYEGHGGESELIEKLLGPNATPDDLQPLASCGQEVLVFHNEWRIVPVAMPATEPLTPRCAAPRRTADG